MAERGGWLEAKMRVILPSIDADRFRKSLVSKKVQRLINEFLEAVGEENLARFARANKDISGLVQAFALMKLGEKPSTLPQAREALRKRARGYGWVTRGLTIAEAYNLIDERYREAIEGQPEGKTWGKKHVKALLGFFS